MKTLKILHLGDLHIDHDPKFKNKIKSSLDQVLEYCTEIKINAIVIPGDIWHRKQYYTISSGLPMALDFFHKLARLVDFVFITKGNHDEAGSIELLHQIEPNIYSYEYPVCLSIEKDSEVVYDMLRDDVPFFEPECIVTLIPYPTKASLLIEDSIDNNNANFIEKFEQIFEHIGEVTQPYTCPKLLAFHGNVVGSRLSSGQTLVSQDIMVAPSTLEKANHSYYALNHIHLQQEIKPNMFYAGGIANFNWGETDQKSFQVITFEDGTMNIERIMLTSARPMIKIDAEFVDGDFKWDLSITDDDNNANAEFRFRCTVSENDRKLITQEKIDHLKKFFGDDVKIEFNIIPDQRESRSEKIMTCKTLLDEVTEYAKVIDYKIDNGVLSKVAELQEKGVEV